MAALMSKIPSLSGSRYLCPLMIMVVWEEG